MAISAVAVMILTISSVRSMARAQQITEQYDDPDAEGHGRIESR